MIRYPKRNAAHWETKPPNFAIAPRPTSENRSGAKRSISKTKPSNSELVLKEYSGTISATGSKHENALYPAGLAKLYMDIDKLVYDRSIIDYECNAPQNLADLEKLADNLLYGFIEEKLKLTSPEKYFANVRAAMGQPAVIMFAYRCAIASMDTDGELVESLEIYKSHMMNSMDFPKTYEDDKINGYEHSNNFRTDRNLVFKLEKFKNLSSSDKMPEFAIEVANRLLLDMGVDIVDSIKTAWLSLSNYTKKSSVEDRIFSRIAYLIANSIFNKAQNLLK